MKKILYLAITLLFMGKAYGLPLVPDLYIWGGAINSNTKIHLSDFQVPRLNIADYISGGDAKSNNTGLAFGFGVRPIDLPVVGGFRIDLQYSNNFNKEAKNEMYGAVLYYDILRIIPIVHPYLGVGVYSSSLNKADVVDVVNQKTTPSQVSFNVGLEASIPILGHMFAEYRFINSDFSGLFASKGIQNQDIMLGFKYYIIS